MTPGDEPPLAAGGTQMWGAAGPVLRAGIWPSGHATFPFATEKLPPTSSGKYLATLVSCMDDVPCGIVKIAKRRKVFRH